MHPIPIPNHQRKLPSAKYEAWKMWHEDGLSMDKVANFPARSAPIKEQTVCEYLLEAAKEGFEIDWPRFCDEIGLTRQIFLVIQGAITKVGSTDKLKPIKNELPEDISYMQIKTCLLMQNCGISLEVALPSDPSISKASELENKVTDSSTKTAPLAFTMTQEQEVPPINDDLQLPEKRQKLNTTEGSSVALEATENSILNWLEKLNEGVSLSDILEHFNGSKKESVIDLVASLECDFLIFKKNNLYRLL
ncbi:hypothetical protein JCGZ_17267 [Jatropha curcas]|uniref:Helicase Helix-turn-helix domain-containing protein n=2 Tax=Jatropha curcas TaxID=180498 RepID=A0A067LLL8_JATCU|nr:hypothetical protein JCGZ_17267 [Jatropha curcas]